MELLFSSIVKKSDLTKFEIVNRNDKLINKWGFDSFRSFSNFFRSNNTVKIKKSIDTFQTLNRSG